MLNYIAGIFNDFGTLNLVNHVFQTGKHRFIKKGTCVHALMHVEFFNYS